MKPKRVAVIDIGSNSIKLLVAQNPSVTPLYHAIRETRMGTGMGKERYHLNPKQMQAAIKSIETLKKEAKPFSPTAFHVVATSAVRDATNQKEFCQLIKRQTGFTLTLLSEKAEATLIAEGLATDPIVKKEKDFTLIDLGGGSVECIAYNGEQLTHALSMPLGAVRLTERFFSNCTEPLTPSIQKKLQDFVRETATLAGFPFQKKTKVFVTGGCMTAARGVLFSRKKDPAILLSDMEALSQQINVLTLKERMKITHLSPQRADIMPVALVTLNTLINMMGSTEIFHSNRNLVYGVANRLLQEKLLPDFL